MGYSRPRQRRSTGRGTTIATRPRHVHGVDRQARQGTRRLRRVLPQRGHPPWRESWRALERRRADDRERGPPARCWQRRQAVCFVGIGLPSTAANLARRLHPTELRADLRVGLHRLEADAPAAVDRRRRARRDGRRRRRRCPRSSPTGCRPGASTSASSAARSSTASATSTRRSSATTSHPKTRLPGAGGAPEIAASAGEVIVDHAPDGARVRRALRLPHVDRASATGRATGSGSACAAAARRWVITDLGMLRPDPDTCELVLTAAPSGRHRASRRSRPRGGRSTRGDARRSPRPPTANELAALARAAARA